MAPHSSTLAWRIPWTEDPGGLQSTGSQRVRQALEAFTRGFPTRFPTGLSNLPSRCESILGLKVEAVQGKKFFLELTETSGVLWEWWHDPGPKLLPGPKMSVTVEIQYDTVLVGIKVKDVLKTLWKSDSNLSCEAECFSDKVMCKSFLGI